MLTLQMPALPDPVRVVLKPATTALLVFDVVEPICKNQPKCTEVMVPAIVSLLAQARKAGVFVLYSTRAPNISKWLPEVLRSGRPDHYVIWSGQILQHRPRPDAEGQGDYHGDSYWLEGQRLRGLYVSWSNTAGLHRRCTHRCQLSRHGLRSGHRPIPNIESE